MNVRTQRKRCEGRAQCVVLTLLLLAAPAVAEQDSDYARTGFYAQAGAAIGFENSKGLDEIEDALNAGLPALFEDLFGPVPGVPSGTTVDRVGIAVDVLAGFSIAGGYRVHPHFAVEGAFDWVTGGIDVDVTVTVPGAGTGSASQKFADYTIWTLTGGLKAYALTGRIQPYASVSVGVMSQRIEDAFDANLSESETDFAPRFGGGLDVYITRSLLVNADAGYVLSTGELEDFDLIDLRIGLGWRF